MSLFTPHLYFSLTSGVWVYELRARRRPCPAALRLRAGLGGQAAHLRPDAGRLDQLREGGQPQPAQSQTGQSHSCGTGGGTHALQRHNAENSKPIFSEKEFLGRGPNFHIHVYVSDLHIYSHDRWAYSAAGKYVDRSWEYIHHSQTHECGTWNWGRAILFLEYINAIFVAVQ
jgi:hypothetical protein